MDRESLTVEMLAVRLVYYPELGIFTWNTGQKGRVGKRAGYLAPIGYREINIYGFKYYEHRLAFLWMIGRFPLDMVDHVNQKKTDNRWENLRECSRAQNMSNRKAYSLLPKGVCRNGKRWFFARITVNKKTIYLGNFDCPKKANEAYKIAAKKYFGEFSCS